MICFFAKNLDFSLSPAKVAPKFVVLVFSCKGVGNGGK